MKRFIKLTALALSAALVFGFASCKPEIEYRDVIVEKDKKGDETAPANVTNLEATAKDSRILLTWTEAADEDVYGYEVSYNGTSAINRVVLPALDSKTMMAGKGAGGCYVSGLTNGTEYTFTVKTVDTSGNKSAGVTKTATPVASAAGETLKIALTASVPHENGYTGNKSNTKVTVTVNITTASNVSRVVWKKNGSLNAKTLLADTAAADASATNDNSKWTFDIPATDETANGTYTVAAIDEAGREEAEQITIDNFDFTAPGKVKVTSGLYSSQFSAIILNWTEPADSDYDHVEIAFTSNDGTSDSDFSPAENFAKGKTEYTFTEIDNTKAYYTYSLVAVDAIGNKSSAYTYKVSVNTTVKNIPEGFVEICAGEFMMGCSQGYDDNKPAHLVNISKDFFMCTHEVTQKEWLDVMGTAAGTYEVGAGDDYPDYYVNWYAAIAYCNKKSIKDGLDPVYTVSGITDWENLAYSSIPTS